MILSLCGSPELILGMLCDTQADSAGKDISLGLHKHPETTAGLGCKSLETSDCLVHLKPDESARTCGD